VVQDLGDEVLVYDRDRDVAHCLSPAAAAVWRRCDGQHDAAELAADVLAELGAKSLLAGEPALGMRRLSRREAIGRLASLGAAVAATPLIVSVVAPSPAQASSTACGLPGEPCTNSGQAPGGCCGSEALCAGGVCCIKQGGACTGPGQCCAGLTCSPVSGCTP
jgi:hypothetical protein